MCFTNTIAIQTIAFNSLLYSCTDNVNQLHNRIISGFRITNRVAVVSNIWMQKKSHYLPRLGVASLTFLTVSFKLADWHN